MVTSNLMKGCHLSWISDINGRSLKNAQLKNIVNDELRPKMMDYELKSSQTFDSEDENFASTSKDYGSFSMQTLGDLDVQYHPKQVTHRSQLGTPKDRRIRCHPTYSTAYYSCDKPKQSDGYPNYFIKANRLTANGARIMPKLHRYSSANWSVF